MKLSERRVVVAEQREARMAVQKAESELPRGFSAEETREGLAVLLGKRRPTKEEIEQRLNPVRADSRAEAESTYAKKLEADDPTCFDAPSEY